MRYLLIRYRVGMRSRCSVVVGCVILAVVVCAHVLFALDRSKTAAGNDHFIAQQSFNVDGANVRVGIIEAAANSDSAGIITSKSHFAGRLIKSYSFLDYPPTPANGASEHGTLVSDVEASNNNTYLGVAPASFILAGWFNDDTEVKRALGYYEIYEQVHLFNNSFGFGDNDNGANQISMFFDWFCSNRDVVCVKSAGNNGDGYNNANSQITVPGDAFNVITVGAVDATFQSRADYSSYLLSQDAGTDRRGKPDIVAPGGDDADRIDNGDLSKKGTSFAAPHVSGIVALLVQDGLTLPGPTLNNRLVHKAIILNSARKRLVNRPKAGDAVSRDNPITGAQESDYDYLDGAALRPGHSGSGLKTAEWTPIEWTFAGGQFTTSRPLDDELGVGVADADRALHQYRAGQHGPGSVTQIGWDLNGVGDSVVDAWEYTIGPSLAAGSFITITLTWDRMIGAVDTGGGIEYYNETEYLPDLNLRVYNTDLSQLYASSLGIGNSLDGQNVEHLHVPVPNAGHYKFRISVDDGTSRYTPYAVAWWTTPEGSSPYGRLLSIPSEFAYPFHTSPMVTKEATITLLNDSDNPINYTRTVSYAWGGGWLSFSSPATGTVPVGEASTEIQTMYATGPALEWLYRATIIYAYNTAAGPATLEIPVELYNFIYWFAEENNSIRTAMVRMATNQTSRVSAQKPGFGFKYFSDGGDTSYMNDGSLLIGTSNMTISMGIFSDSAGLSGHGDTLIGRLYCLTNMTYDTLPNYQSWGYRHSYGTGCNRDSTIAFDADFFAPRHVDSANFMIGKFSLYAGPKYPDATINNVTVCYAADWDVPDDSGENIGGFDAALQMVYQQGAYGYNTARYAALSGWRDDGTAINGGMVLDNPTWVYPHTGYMSDSIWTKIQSTAGFSTTDSITDLNSTLVFSKNATIRPKAAGVFTIYVVLAGQPKVGGSFAGLKAEIAKAKKFMCNYLSPNPILCSQCDDCGDANSDGVINISDAVFLIAYIFAGGAAPEDCNYPRGMGDANGDAVVNISDAVYLIAYIFAGGAAPHCHGM